MAETELVEAFTVREYRTLRVDDSMDALIAALGESPQDVFPVLDAKGRLAGTVGEMDLLRVLDPGQQTLSSGAAKLLRDGFATEVEDVMTPRPLTVAIDEPVTAALKRMAAMRTPNLIVVDREQAPVGMLRVRDLYVALAGRKPE